MLACTNTLFQAGDVFYRQTDGVAMGSPLGPLLANIFLSQYDGELASHSKVYLRYVDDIVRDMPVGGLDYLLPFANTIHNKLKFTAELEDPEQGLAFLDMRLKVRDGRIHISWYTKKTDTGVLLNYNACCPRVYKSGIVTGAIHRIFNATNSWAAFSDGINAVQQMLRDNQYPAGMVRKLTNSALSNILQPSGRIAQEPKSSEQNEPPPSLKLEYRGPDTDKLATKLKKATEKCNIYFTTCKLRNMLPSLKSRIPVNIRSSVVYSICCPTCSGAYIGQTVRHLSTRIKEHARKGSPVSEHFRACDAVVTMGDVELLDSSRHTRTLMALEAIYIRRKKPSLNTRDEYRSRRLHYVF